MLSEEMDNKLLNRSETEPRRFISHRHDSSETCFEPGKAGDDLADEIELFAQVEELLTPQECATQALSIFINMKSEDTISTRLNTGVSRKEKTRMNLASRFPLLLSLILLFDGTVLSQKRFSPVEIRGIAVEEKANGALIRIKKTGSVSDSQITAWTSGSQWFYVTILGGTIDTTYQFSFIQTGIVKDFQSRNLPESAQLSFQTTKKVEVFEIDTSANGDEILIMLRLPLEETVASIEKLKSLQGEEVAIGPAESPTRVEIIVNKIPLALVITGSAFVISGLIDSEGRELAIGGVMIISGYWLIKKRPTLRQSS